MSDYASKIDALDTLEQSEWADGYTAGLSAASEIASAADTEIDTLRARVAELEEALKPFAQMLERYDLDIRPLIALADDDTGARLNVSHADSWRNARTALKDT